MKSSCFARIATGPKSAARILRFRQLFQRDLVVQPSCDKIFRFTRRSDRGLHLRALSHERGVSRSSRTLGQDVVDAAASGAHVIAGRLSVSDRTARKTNGADGGVRQNRVVLAPVAGVKLAEVCEPYRVSIEPLIRQRRRQKEFVSGESTA